MKKLVWLSLTAMALVSCASNESKESEKSGDMDAAKDSGWVSLFDGKSLDGWHAYGKGDLQGRWKIYDSTLVLDSSVHLSGVNGNLISDDEYDNFHLKLDWKISQAGNSGILFYVNEDTSKYSEPYETGPEMQVVDNDGHPDGKIFKHQAGDLYDLIPCSTKTVKPVGEWNHVEIIADQGKLDFFLNGTNVVSTHMWDAQWDSLVANSKFKSMPGFGTFKKGAVCLQDHGDVVSYKNIMIRKL